MVDVCSNFKTILSLSFNYLEIVESIDAAIRKITYSYSKNEICKFEYCPIGALQKAAPAMENFEKSNITFEDP